MPVMAWGTEVTGMGWDMQATDTHMLLVLDIMDIILARDLLMPNLKQRLTLNPGMEATDMVVDTMAVIMAVDTMVVIHTDTDMEDTGVKQIMSSDKEYSNFTTRNVFDTIITREFWI